MQAAQITNANLEISDAGCKMQKQCGNAQFHSILPRQQPEWPSLVPTMTAHKTNKWRIAAPTNEIEDTSHVELGGHRMPARPHEGILEEGLRLEHLQLSRIGKACALLGTSPQLPKRSELVDAARFEVEQ